MSDQALRLILFVWVKSLFGRMPAMTRQEGSDPQEAWRALLSGSLWATWFSVLGRAGCCAASGLLRAGCCARRRLGSDRFMYGPQRDEQHSREVDGMDPISDDYDEPSGPKLEGLLTF